MKQKRFLLEESELPREWYNIQAEMPTKPMPAIHPATRQPLGVDDLAHIFPRECCVQELDAEHAWIPIPDEVQAKLNSSRPESWADTYDARCRNAGERDLRVSEAEDEVKNEKGVDWTLRLFDGAAQVKSSRGTDRFPPGEQWNAFRLLTEFCFSVTRRYGAPPEAV